MRALLASLTIAAGVVTAAPPAVEAAQRDRPGCGLKASATLVRNGVARVYAYRGDLWACVRRTGRRIRLAHAYDDGYVMSGNWSGVRLAGPFAAWRFEAYDISCKAACPPEYQPTRITVTAYDLRARRKANELSWAGAYELTTGGGLAWLEEAGEGGVVLRGQAPATDPVVLDSGAIDPATVRAYHRLILWEKGGERRWAPLP